MLLSSEQHLARLKVSETSIRKLKVMQRQKKLQVKLQLDLDLRKWRGKVIIRLVVVAAAVRMRRLGEQG